MSDRPPHSRRRRRMLKRNVKAGTEGERWVVTWKMPFPAVYVVIIKTKDRLFHIPA